jgi:hypothetical protein
MAQDAHGRVPLDFPGTTADLSRNSIELQNGIRLVLYTNDATASVDPDDLVCVGEVEFDDGSRRWWARYDWQALKHVSELDEDDRIEYLKLRRSK